MTHAGAPGRASAASLLAALAERILVLDGATGTYLQGLDLTAADFGGPDLEGCNEHLVLSRPDVIQRMHEDYFAAGADIAETNTFGATPIVLAEYGLAALTREINVAAARLAAQARDEAMQRDGRPRFVAGSMGPTTRSLSVTGGATFAEMTAAYREQALGLIEGGCDLLLVETCQDTLNVKAAILAIEEAREAAGRAIPLAISCTLEPTGTMLAGQDIEAFWISIEHARPIFVGLNCSTGPEAMTDHLRALAEIATCATSCHPNAGLPDEDGCYHESPEHLSARLRHFVENGWLNVVGGCCGTTPRHVRLLADAVAGLAPRAPAAPGGSRFAGLEAIAVLPENRPLIVGERTNVIGSRKFRELVHAGDHDAAAEVGRRQVRGGAQLLDACLSDPDRDERADMVAVLRRLVRKVRVPVLIDTTDQEVLEAALQEVQGKSIVNSINFENGDERFEAVAPLARRYGAAVVCGCIDEHPEHGMAITATRKLEIARRSVAWLTRAGMSPRDVLIDPLVFPAGTGDVNHLRSARETIEGVRLIKQELPECPLILGISNVSFGLPEAAREVVNSVFLHDCTKAGLDLAIVNSERIQRYASIVPEERELAADLLHARREDALERITTHFRGKRATRDAAAPELPVEQRLARFVVEGVQDGLIPSLDEARARWPPLKIINGPLMAGMDEVGRLFNANELIVAEVLQSAEVMKAAVTHLDQFMEKATSRSRGKVVLATVRGDVHDIGKNLVEIILANNGYEVVNLGIKVLPETLVRAAREHAPDAIGLSGLLVKSAREMVVTATSFREAGLRIPVLVGGAALTRRFTLTRIQPEYEGPVLYCRDATTGLDVLNRLREPAAREELLAANAQEREAMAAAIAAEPADIPSPAPPRERPPAASFRRCSPPDLLRHEIDDIDFATLEPWINVQSLYGKHLGMRGVVARLFEEGDAKALELRARVHDVIAGGVAEGLLRARACWRFFPAVAVGDSVVLLDRPRGRELARFDFPRQRGGERLCLSDFVASSDPVDSDHVILFVTTCGQGIRARARALIDAGSYLDAHSLQAVALEGAEAAAEWLHATLRRSWGFPDPPDLSRADVFRARYRGLRVSFGYPACPRLEDQRTLFELLRPESIGVSLTEGFMMEPEASVSALVFQHPDAKYFSVEAERS